MKLATRQKKLWKRLTDAYRVPRIVNGTLMRHQDTGKPIMRRIKTVHEFMAYYGSALDRRHATIVRKYSAKK